MIKIIAMGDNVVDCYLAKDTMFPGGNCLNVAVFASKLGGKSAYIGAIGRDKAGDAIWQALEAEKVDRTCLRRLDGATAYCVIGHCKGERIFVRFDLGVSMFEPLKADFDFITAFDGVHIGQSSGLDTYLAQVRGLARLSYDFSDQYDDRKITRISPLCWLASLSAKKNDRDYALSLLRTTLAKGAKYCLVTRGEQGAILGVGKEIFEVAAVKTDVVDTLGAGDSFIARTLIGLLREEQPTLILHEAAHFAAHTCGHNGAFGRGVALDSAIR